ncbi:MAG: Fis family transcriptional regulator [Campylobacterota bacterium]|nr:Fis family transcriptional regulator [Campylobacterota bacterium]
MDATNFLTASNASIEAFKTANLLKSLFINLLIVGERGVGKKQLASYILPNAPIISAQNHNELISAIESSDEVIISNIDKSSNLQIVVENISKFKPKVIIIGSSNTDYKQLNDICGINISLPPLSQRLEDAKLLLNEFILEAEKLFDTSYSLDIDINELDLSQNAISLKKQIFFRVMMQGIDENEIMSLIEHYLNDKIGTQSDYRNFIYLYEVPLINAGFKKFGSQFKMSDMFGLNRNTLRKKISENSKYLKDI